MHITSKINRCLSKIEAFMSRRDYSANDAPVYESTRNSLTYLRSQLYAYMNKEGREENVNGSHYRSCQFKTKTGYCQCQADNAAICVLIDDCNRLMRGM